LSTHEGAAVHSDEEILRALGEMIREAIAVEQPEVAAGIDATLDTRLLSLPLDSLGLVGLMSHIEERFGIYVDEEEAFAFETVRDVVASIREKLDRKAHRAEAAS
jgi:acyl carrier protein